MKQNEDIGYLLHKIHNKIRARIDARYKKYDLTFSQSQVLFQLRHEGGSMSQKDLQKRLKISHPTLTGLIKRLEAHDFISSAVDEKDRRNRIITVTQNADAFATELMHGRTETNRQMLKGFSEEEKKELEGYLQRIAMNLEEQKGESL